MNNAVIPLDENSTILDAMKVASRVNDCFGYAGNYGQYGCFITKVCNIENNTAGNLFWMVLVNGEMTPKGVSTCGIKNNDVVTLNYMNTTQNSHNSSSSCAFVGTADPEDTCSSYDVGVVAKVQSSTGVPLVASVVILFGTLLMQLF